MPPPSAATGANAGVFIPPGAAGSVYSPPATVLGWLSAVSYRAGTSSQAVSTSDTADGPATA